MFEKSNKTFIELSEEEIQYLLENVRCFSWWTGRNLNLVCKDTYDGWHEVYSDGGGAIGILSNDKVKDLFTRCRYQLDTRDIKYISS